MRNKIEKKIEKRQYENPHEFKKNARRKPIVPCDGRGENQKNENHKRIENFVQRGETETFVRKSVACRIARETHY